MNKRILFIVLVVLSLLWTAFIFSHSLQDAAKSKETSNRVVDIIIEATDLIGININEAGGGVTIDKVTLFVRKTAHFLEFAVLGALSFFAVLNLLGEKKALFSLFYPLIVAISDETIQSFSPGRSNQLSDVILDMSGAIFAVLICFLFVKIYKQKRYKSTILDKTENISSF